MAITKDKKREILARLAEALREASSVAFVGFNKLTVADASRLRRELSQAGVRFYVAKKTLLRLALEQESYAGQVPELPGEVAIAWTASPVGDAAAADTTAPARGVYTYGKKLKGALTLLGGVLEGAFTDAQKMATIAIIPPLPILRGMFVNVINSPIQGFVVALDKIREQKAA